MRPLDRRNSRPVDQTFTWIAIAAVAVLALGLIWIWISRHPNKKTVQDFPVTWTLRPTWSNAESFASARERAEPLDLAIYFDVSQPLGGFLPPTRGGEPSDYEFLFNQIPDRLVAEAGGSRSHISWWAVDSGLTSIERPQPLERSRFKGRESRLDLSVTELIKGFAGGHLRAAVLVTDLISTEELTGAMGVAKALSDWMSSHAVQEGSFHAGLLGVRASYWGVETPRCPAPAGTPCWFSEQSKAWKILPGVTKISFYILVLGRSEAEVIKIGEGLQESAKRRKIDTRWELLSAIAHEQKISVNCHLARPGESGEQFILVRDEKGAFTCQESKEVEIACPLPTEAQVGEPTIVASWPGVHAELRDARAVVVTLDCAALRKRPPTSELTLRLTGPPIFAPTKTWEGWSTDSDATVADLGKTLQLDSFLEKVKPRPVQMEFLSSPLLLGRRLED